MAEYTIIAQINPLEFLEVDVLPAGTDVDISAEKILAFLGNPSSRRSIPDMIDRYKKISVESPRLFAAPSEARLLERLIWPLRQAKGSFMLENYLGAISLCGMVAEMAAILAFDLSDIRVDGAVLDSYKQKSLFGNTFEKLGQERRISVLTSFGLIDEQLKRSFDTVRSKRRNYLHLWSEDHESLEKDAVDCYKSAVNIVIQILGLSISDGKVIFKPQVFDYLARNNAGPVFIEDKLSG